MKRFGLILLVLFAVSLEFPIPVAHSLAAGSTQASQSTDIQKPIADTRNQIRQWTTSADIQVALVILVGAFGALISALHRSSGEWAKRAVLFMGVVTSIATGISGSNAVFTADYRSLRQASSEGNRIVARMDSIASTPNLSAMSPEEYAVVRQEMDAQLNNFDTIAQKIDGSQNAAPSTIESAASVFSIPVVHAQSSGSEPAWIQNLPSDPRNLYFVGVNSNPSLVTAKENSLKDAQQKLEQAFELTPPYVSAAARQTLILNSYSVQDTYFKSNGGNSFVFYTLLRISRDLQRMQAYPLEFVQKDWHPADLAFNPTSGMFVLDHDGRVFRIGVQQIGIQVQQLFQMPPGSGPAALAANESAVFVSANTPVGCTIFQYSLSNAKISKRSIGAGQGSCDGIAVYGSALYLAIPSLEGVRYWANWDSGASFQTLSIPERTTNCMLHFDTFGNRLIVTTGSGTSYAVSPGEGRSLKLDSGLGFVNSVSSSSNRLLFASGSKVLFYARVSNVGQTPPRSMRSLNGGLISGVAVDSSGAAWIVDFDKSAIRGPFPLE